MPANKLLSLLDGKSVIRRTVEAVCDSRVDPVIVVTGHVADRIRDALAGLSVTITENVRFTDGLSTSLIHGLRHVTQASDGFIVVLGDMPFVPSSVIDAMIDAFVARSGATIVVPTYKGNRGNPVLWPTALRSEFETLSGDRGAKQLMALHGDLLYELEVGTDAVLTDLDTPEDFSRA